MPAEPQLAPGPERERPPAPEPVQEAPPENLLKKDLGEGGLKGAERELETAGMEKLNEMGKNLDLQAMAGAQEFGEKTKSWWDRAKGVFKKKDAAPVKGEEEILGELEKADAVYAEFKGKYAEIMASGDEAALRGMEGSLSQAYEQLAPQVAMEGAADSKAMKKALKTGEMPQMTQTGAKLNDVTRRLMEVRSRLNGEAPSKAEATPQAEVVTEAAPAAEPTQAEKDLDEAIARGVAEYEAEQGIAPKQAEAVPDKAAKEREQLMKDSAGKPGEKLVDEYLKLGVLKSDKYGNIVGKSFDPIKGEIRLKYEDGSQLRKYATGLMLRIQPGGNVETVEPEPVPQAEAVPASPVEGTEENPILLTPEMRVPSTENETELPATKHEVEDDMIESEEEADDGKGPEAAREAKERLSEWAELHDTPTMIAKRLEGEGAQDLRDVAILPLVLEDARENLAADKEKTGSTQLVSRMMEFGIIDDKTAEGLSQSPKGMKTLQAEVVKYQEDLLKRLEKIQGEVPKETNEKTETLLRAEKSGDAYRVTAKNEDGQKFLDSMPGGFWKKDREMEKEPAQPEKSETPTEAEPEKKETPFDKLESGMSAAAAEIIKMMPEEAKSPNTFRAKVGRLPADKFLGAFLAAGAVSESEAKDLAQQFKVEAEEFSALRKKLAQAAQKQLKG